MKIAQLAPPWISVPPNGYGGIEWVVSLLAEELIAAGHNVTLFASGDSITAGKLDYVYESAQTERLGSTAIDAIHVAHALSRADEFDIIHDHSGFLAVAFAKFIKTPVLHTLHGPFEDDTKAFYGRVADSCYYNAISEYQKSCFPLLNYVDTVYNAIDVEGLPFKETKQDFLLMLSRVSEIKGTHLAIDIAESVGKRLIIAGKVDPIDRAYFESKVQPRIDGDRIIFLGEIDNATKRQLMADARSFIFPIQWPEPFGLVMAEAMAAGTPVIAMRNGSVPEVVSDGNTGYVVDSIEEMISAVSRVEHIDPKACRRHVETLFHPRQMARRYEENYRRILEQEREAKQGQRSFPAA